MIKLYKSLCQSFTYAYLLGLFIALLCSSGLVKGQEVDDDKGNLEETSDLKQVKIAGFKQLPEPYSDDQLPGKPDKTDTCFYLIGCFQRLPEVPRPKDPYKYNTQFVIQSSGREGKRASEANEITSDEQQNEVQPSDDPQSVIKFELTSVCLEGKKTECANYPFDLSQLQGANFNPRWRTVIIVHGWHTKLGCNWQRELAQIWLRVPRTNVITTCWPQGCDGLYKPAVANSKAVARQIVVLMYYLAKLHKFELSDETIKGNIYIIGHSLGAHIAAFVGQDFGGQIGRISGLDPAGPNFYGSDLNHRLDRSDARLVDVWHTNDGEGSKLSPYFGNKMFMGHLDLVANDGSNQPHCRNPFHLSCNHMASVEYFTRFLQHQVDIKEEMGLKYNSNHRLFSFKSDQGYESFNSGSSLAKFCPRTTLDDSDLLWEDLDLCAIPIDIVTPSNLYIEELKQKHSIDFNSLNPAYFHTIAGPPYVNNHNLIKIRLIKSKQMPEQELTCDIALEMKMDQQYSSKHSIDDYKLIDAQDHYEIMLPFSSPDTYSRYAIAELDSNDFYLKQEDHSQLLKLLKRILPIEVKVIGTDAEFRDKNPSGFFGKLKSYLFGDSKKAKSDKIHRCHLEVQTITIQPLKRLHRHLVASYSGQQKAEIKIDILNENKGISSETTTSGSSDKQAESAGATELLQSPVVFLDTVVLGPYSDKVDQVKDIPEVDFDEESSDGEESDVPIDSTSLSGRLWLFLTLSVLLIVIFFSVYYLFKVTYPDEVLLQDKLSIISNEEL